MQSVVKEGEDGGNASRQQRDANILQLNDVQTEVRRLLYEYASQQHRDANILQLNDVQTEVRRLLYEYSDDALHITNPECKFLLVRYSNTYLSTAMVEGVHGIAKGVVKGSPSSVID
jgi:hypothetical protein